MRHTCIDATGSSVCFRLPHLRARVWVVAFSSVLLCIDAQPVIALDGLRLLAYFAVNDTSSPPGPSVLPVPGGMVDSGAPLPSASNLYSETYWTAFADLDLPTLVKAARTGPEARFAEAMTLLATGNHESAESAFVAVSQQAGDLNVVVAAQVMLATTLRYEGKWKKLRDISLNTRLGPEDRKVTSDLERWGKAFATAEQQVVAFPDKAVTLPLKLTAVGTPTIHVRINGKDYDFWLDTGSSVTVVSSAVAADAEIAELSPDTLLVRTFAGTVPVRAVSVKRVEIGSIVFTNSPAVVIDESLMYMRETRPGARAGGIRVDGIIGWDTIRQLDLWMDYYGGTVLLRRPAARGTSGTSAQNLAWLGKPLVEVRTKGGIKLHFTIDTGAESSFLNAIVLEKTGIATKLADNRVFGIARTGRETDRVVPFLRIEVGGKSLRLPDVIVYGPVTSGLINCDGILGSDIARFGEVHIDATNGLFSIGRSDGGEDPAE